MQVKFELRRCEQRCALAVSVVVVHRQGCGPASVTRSVQFGEGQFPLIGVYDHVDVAEDALRWGCVIEVRERGPLCEPMLDACGGK